jgi:hypothetical protein
LTHCFEENIKTKKTKKNWKKNGGHAMHPSHANWESEKIQFYGKHKTLPLPSLKSFGTLFDGEGSHSTTQENCNKEVLGNMFRVSMEASFGSQQIETKNKYSIPSDSFTLYFFVSGYDGLFQVQINFCWFRIQVGSYS